MKAFKFSLEPVLILRHREEDAAKHSYAEAVGFRNRCLEALEQAMVDLEGLQRELGATRQGLSRRDDQILFIHAIRQQRDFCLTVTQRLARAEQLIQVRMEAWMVARRKADMLVRLKQKHQQEYNFVVQRLEERAIDDIVSARHVMMGRKLAN